MGLLTPFRRARGNDLEHQAEALAEAKAGVGAVTVPSLFQGGMPHYPDAAGPAAFTALSREAFQKNEIAFACLSLLMRTFTEAPVAVQNAEGEAVPGTLLRRILDRPNPFHSEQELWETYVLHRRLAGNFFLEKVRSAAGRVVELWTLRPDRMRVIPDRERFIAGWIYEIGGEEFPLRPEDVVHIRAPAPLDAYFGMPDLRAGLRSIALDNEMTDMAKVIAQNRGVNPGTVMTTEMTSADDDRIDRIRRKWYERFNRSRRGGLAVLLKGMDVKTVGMPLNELAWPDLRDVTEARICGALDVPPIMVGANVGLKRSTYANYEHARQSFWMETIAPDHRKVAAKLAMDRDLGPGEGGRVVFDTTEVHALKTVRNEAFDRANAAVAAGWLTVNQALALVGKKPVEGGDVYLRPLAMREVPVGESEPREPASPERTPATTPTPGTEPRSQEIEESVEEGDTAQKEIVLNGAQVQLLVTIVQEVSRGQLPRASAVEIIVAAFGLRRERAEAILGEAGRSFRPTQTETEVRGAAVLRHVKQMPAWIEAKDPVSRSRALAQVRVALGRMDAATSLYDRIHAWASEELAAQGRDVMEAFSEATKALRPTRGKALDEEARSAILDALTRMTGTWAARIEESGGPLLTQIIEDAAESAAAEIGADFAAQREAIAAFARDYVVQLAGSVSTESQHRVSQILERSGREALTVSETRALLLRDFTGDPVRASRIARTETIRGANAGAEASYQEAGVTEKRWIAAGDSCPYCDAMDGTVIQVSASFLEQGATFQPDGADRPLHADYDAVANPPLHPNCRCAIVAEV